LFPCIVEYSLVAVGILYHIYSNVGRVQATAASAAPTPDGPKESITGVDCTKSTSGLFAGLTVLIASIVAIICYLSNQIPDVFIGEAVLFIDVLPNASLIIVVTALFIKFRNLQYVYDNSEEVIIILEWSGR